MNYIAINVNYKMDMDWYHRCNSVVECLQYFDRLEVGDGNRSAIYDNKKKHFIWIDDDSADQIDRLQRIVAEAQQKPPVKRKGRGKK